jgi:hypothetical protein
VVYKLFFSNIANASGRLVGSGGFYLLPSLMFQDYFL